LRLSLAGISATSISLRSKSTDLKRHNGTDAPPVKDRPRKGHIGFQELSRGAAHVMIRNARIKVLD